MSESKIWLLMLLYNYPFSSLRASLCNLARLGTQIASPQMACEDRNSPV